MLQVSTGKITLRKLHRSLEASLLSIQNIYYVDVCVCIFFRRANTLIKINLLVAICTAIITILLQTLKKFNLPPTFDKGICWFEFRLLILCVYRNDQHCLVVIKIKINRSMGVCVCVCMCKDELTWE